MESIVLLRYAEARDAGLRAQLVRDALAQHNWDMFLALLLQETTLQFVVLSCAALFIFMGASVYACLMVPVCVSVLIRVGVTLAHHAQSESVVADMRREQYGIIAELRSVGTHMLGTVSVLEHHGLSGGGWIRVFILRNKTCHVQTARMLLERAASRAHFCGMSMLECDVTHLHPTAITLLQRDGWISQGASERVVAGGAFTVHVFRLQLTLKPVYNNTDNNQQRKTIKYV